MNSALGWADRMRYLPLTPSDRTDMLAAIGAPSVDDLFRDVPASARLSGLVELPRHKGELWRSGSSES